MKNEHIFDILDEKSFAELSEKDLQIINLHTADCPSCGNAFRAARVSSNLLKIESEDFSPSPFFQARLMANLRERQEKLNPFAALLRLWKASGAMVVLMLVFVFGLIALTLVTPRFNDVSSGSQNSVPEIYSTDMVISSEKISFKEPTNEQVFRMIYASEGLNKK